MRQALGAVLARLATWIAGECPCERCSRMRVNAALLAAAPRVRRRQLARDLVRRSGSGGPST